MAALLVAGCQQSSGADDRPGLSADATNEPGPVLPVTDVQAGSGSSAGGDGGIDNAGRDGNGDCAALGSSDWKAWVNAMPGPEAKRTLIVEGKVRVPSAGHRASLNLGEIAESHPLQVTVRLSIAAPSEPSAQVVTTRDVRGDWPVQGDVGSVAVRCGSETLARIASVETAR